MAGRETEGRQDQGEHEQGSQQQIVVPVRQVSQFHDWDLLCVFLRHPVCVPDGACALKAAT